MSNEAALEIAASFELSHIPSVLDVSGAVPFDVTISLRRSKSDLSRPMHIMTK